VGPVGPGQEKDTAGGTRAAPGAGHLPGTATGPGQAGMWARGWAGLSRVHGLTGLGGTQGADVGSWAVGREVDAPGGGQGQAGPAVPHGHDMNEQQQHRL